MSRSTVGYLSAALRVSTRPAAEAAGPRSHILGVMSAFDALGWHVVPFIVGDQMPEELVTKGSRQVIGRSSLLILIADVVRVASGIANAWRAWYKLGNQVDVVYERLAVLQCLGWIFKKRSIPWILESNGLMFYEAKHERNNLLLYRLARHIELSAYRSCDVLVCVSHNLKQLIVKTAKLNPEKIIVLPNGVDTDFFSPTDASPRRMFQGLTLGYVGGVIPRQGLSMLIDVLAELVHGMEIDDLFLVVVGDGTARPRLQSKAADLELDSHIQFTGLVSRDETPAYIAGFDIGFSGQVTQPIGEMYHSPLKIYEYMAMAKPVLASRFSDAQEVIRHQETGYLFEPGDKRSLRETLLAAYYGRLDLPEMGRKAREEVVQNHSWTSRVTRLVSRTEGLLNAEQ